MDIISDDREKRKKTDHMEDGWGRTIDYLRLSVTDRCNLRCQYCMPKEGVHHLSHDAILRYDEMIRTVRIMSEMGLKNVRITGGEPLVRKNVEELVKGIRSLPNMESIGMTTNGLLLEPKLDALAEAGIDSLNISLDSIHPETYKELTRGGDVQNVLHLLERVRHYPFQVKINCVAMQQNRDDVLDIARIAKDNPFDVRFIEMMPMGEGRQFPALMQDDLVKMLETEFGPGTVSPKKHGNGPACYLDFQGFCASVGFIHAVSHGFCQQCNRVRLTAEGDLKLCLNFDEGISLKKLLRSGADDDAIKRQILSAIKEKPKEHAFGQKMAIYQKERKGMSQIGG